MGEKQKILDEFVALTVCHRKHAIWIPRGEHLAVTRDRIYGEAVRQALIMLRAAADSICGKRLKVIVLFLTDAMERYGYLDLDQNVKDKATPTAICSVIP